MSEKWTPEEDAAISTLLDWEGSETEMGREGVMLLSDCGSKRSQSSVVHRLRKLREIEKKK